MPDTLRATAATAAPTPLEPVGDAVVPRETAVFRWAAPPGAGPFDLRVASAADPGTPLVDLQDLAATEATVADALPAGPCVWWVRPSGGAWGQPATFRAGTAADLAVAAKEASEAAARREAVVEAAPVVPPEPVWPRAEGPALPGAPAVDWSTVPGFVRPVRIDVPTVDAAPPRPEAPLGGAVVDAMTVALRWGSAPGAVGYEVELSPEADFSDHVLALDAGAATEVALPGLVPATGPRLFWRVRARTAAGPTAWSRRGRFYPALGAPVDQFRAEREAAVVAFRKRREYDRQQAAAACAALPLHEQEGPAGGDATYRGVVVMLALSIASALTVLAASLLVG